jgi:ribulose-bisphosphate carboxylase small chain
MSRFETFSFLPPLAPSQQDAQLSLALTKGWLPQIEYQENPTHADVYWRVWPIPPQRRAVDGTPEPLSSAHVLAHLEACARRHPYATVRLTAYDPTTRHTRLSFIAKTPQEGV